MNVTSLPDKLVIAIDREAANHDLTEEEKDFVLTVLGRINTHAMEQVERAMTMARLAPPWEDGFAIAKAIIDREMAENENELKAKWHAGFADQERPDVIRHVLDVVEAAFLKRNDIPLEL